MAVVGKNRHYRWKEIEARHWIETAKRQGLPGMKEIIAELIEQTPGAIARTRDSVPAGLRADVADAIFDGLAEGAKN